MWRELVEKASRDRTFHPPTTPERLNAAEKSLGAALPAELRALLLESNGVLGEYDLGLVWSIERIEEDNRRLRAFADFRQLYMPFDSLLFFGDTGTGDQFAFAVLDGAVRRSDVYEWDHENDSRSWVAPSLKAYLEWTLAGRI